MQTICAHGLRRVATVLALAMLCGVTGTAEIIDRVLAVVNGAVILQSDSRAVLRLGLVEMPSGAEPLRAVLDRLIERRLILLEAQRSGTPDPAAAAVEARLAEVRSRFASDEAFATALAELGLTPDQVRSYIKDDFRMAAYIQRRFGSTVQPSDADLVELYRQHPERFTRNGVLQPFNEVMDAARTMAIAERQATLVRDWVAGLRRRADVTIPAVVTR